MSGAMASSFSRRLSSLPPCLFASLPPYPRSSGRSNRKSYEKLELALSPIKRRTSIFLIVKKTHFLQARSLRPLAPTKERSAASLPALAGDLLPSPASPTRNTAIRPTSSPCGPAIPPSSASAALSSAKSKASPPPAKFCSPPAATPAESKLRQTLR